MPWWAWLVLVLVAFWVIGYIIGPQTGKATTKRDKMILDRRAVQESGQDWGLITRLRNLRESPVVEWSLCPRCLKPLEAVEDFNGSEFLTHCTFCSIVYSEPGVQPIVDYTTGEAQIVGIKEYKPILPSDLHRIGHPNIWIIRPADVAPSFPDVLGDTSTEGIAFGLDPDQPD